MAIQSAPLNFCYRYQGSVTSETWHTAIDEHEAIIALLTARDGERLGQFLRRHVQSTWSQIAPDTMIVAPGVAAA